MNVSLAAIVLAKVLGLLTGASAGPPAGSASYKVLMAGNPAGAMTRSVDAGGEMRFTFEFNDRGRGPKLETRMRLGPDGAPVLVETQGHDYLKSPVSERFTLEGGRAVWKNPSESGESRPPGSAYYLSLNAVPEEMALLARALRLAPGKRLPLLPEGEASLEQVAERTVHAGGADRAVTLYAISGLDFTPTFVWLDADGAFFAAASDWFTVVREGWEGSVPDLLKAQDAAESVRAAALVRAASRNPGHPLVFRNANVFDSAAAVCRPGTTVVVSGDRISAVGPDGSVAVPADAEVIDAAGKTLLPGLWDMHVHVGDVDGPLNIAAGVTSVRDLANDIDKLASLRKRWEDGSAIGPRVLAAGFLDGPGPYAGPTKVLVDTPEQVRAAIARYADLGYVQIKVYSSIRPELVPGIIADAHARGMRVSGHVPAFMTAEQFVKLGADELQHVNFLFLNFWADTVPDTRTPARFTAVAEKAASLDLDSDRVKAFLRLLKDHGTVCDPTVSVFEEMFTARPGTISPPYAAVAARMPAGVRRGFLTGGLPVPEGSDRLYRDSFRQLLAMVKRLEQEGIPIVAGTDALAGFTLHRELELYVEAGIPAPRVLQIATLGAARVMKRDGELGAIAPGKKADLVLVDGDPSRRISDVRRTVTVLKNGVVYDPAAISRALGIRPAAGATGS